MAISPAVDQDPEVTVTTTQPEDRRTTGSGGGPRSATFRLVLLGVLVVLALIVDFAATALGAKKVGASKKAIAGSVAGTFVGLFFGLPGLLLGPFVGAVLGELAAQRYLDQATRVGIATWVGLLLGTIAKLALSLTMLGVFAISYFW